MHVHIAWQTVRTQSASFCLESTITMGYVQYLATSRCAGCLTDFKFSTSSRTKGMSGGHYWECNFTSVWGQMITGEGHAPLMELMAVLGVTSLMKKTFMTREKHIGKWWWDSLSCTYIIITLLQLLLLLLLLLFGSFAKMRTAVQCSGLFSKSCCSFLTA